MHNKTSPQRSLRSVKPHFSWILSGQRRYCSLFLQTAKTQIRPSSKLFLLTVPGQCFFCGSFVFFVSCISHAFASVHCCLVVTCWERAWLLLVMCIVFCYFPMWYPGSGVVLESFPDFCRLSYFVRCPATLPEAANQLPVLE